MTGGDEVVLWVERVMFCDLLYGRVFRGHAQGELDVALRMEALGASAEEVKRVLDRAAHMEWIASITEQGKVLWGSRRRRSGEFGMFEAFEL